MQRLTIDYGIDLGTTNSEVAILQGTAPRIIPNGEGASYTPSAVWIDKRGHLFVGSKAKQHQDDDPDNCAVEFKLKMGLGENARKQFVRSGRVMLPEELSAEVLKSLRADVQAQTGEELRAAVMTVPADFQAPQSNATVKAAKMAGLEICTLLQEPVAAALAYAFQGEDEKVFWLVYDFGGGTFDAAVMQIRDEVIQVVNHAGDNYLGGKLIDWDIVEKRFMPQLASRHKLADFTRGNEKWKVAVAKLKLAAEQAKIEVCRTESPCPVWIESLCKDDSGNDVDFEYTLTPGEVEETFAPYVERSLNLCRKALGEKGLAGADIQKVLMVGGTTCNRWLRERVGRELGAPLEFSKDPMTVVAQGAAIFAGTQRMPDDPSIVRPAGTIHIELEYKPIDATLDPPVAGRLRHPSGRSLKGYTVEIVAAKSQWRSGRITLADEGVFMTEVHAERGERCEFLIEVADPSGTRQKTDPDRFYYTTGITSGETTLIHTIGVGLADGRVSPFHAKGATLPAEKLIVFKTVHAVRKGQQDDVLCIPVVEGENLARSDRNRLVNYLRIPSKDIKRDVPEGSEVEVTVVIDKSQLITTTAYIPVLDEEFEDVLKLENVPSSVPELRRRLERTKERLSKCREEAREADDPGTRGILARIDAERMQENLESNLAAATADMDALRACENGLLSFEAAVDDLESALAWPKLVKEARAVLADAKKIVGQYGKGGDAKRLADLDRGTNAALSTTDRELVRQRVDEMRSLCVGILSEQQWWWVEGLEYYEGKKLEMRDQAEAQRLFARGRRAISDGDVEGLKAAVRQLAALMPDVPPGTSTDLPSSLRWRG